MKLLKGIQIFIFSAAVFVSCTSSTEPTNNSNTPTGHTVNKNGIMHKTGLNSPTTNCVECHGTDLRGGSVGVSCYSCHGKKW